MTLSNVNKDEIFTVISMPDGEIRSQAIRLGVFEGAVLKCVYNIKGGPIVLDNKGQEIAIGYNIAKSITVERISNM